jgi:protein gp37
MSKNSHIEWTNHTFNPWWGCAKVSPACKYCYAEKHAARWAPGIWGEHHPRQLSTDAYWNAPIRWNKAAIANGSRERVFCASMSDVYEDRADVNESRERLWTLIEETSALDWLLLTKRPQNILAMSPWGDKDWPSNVWVGTTVENQKYADERLPALLSVPAACRFLSCEPLLGSVDLSEWLGPKRGQKHHPIDWVIVGGESGPQARMMNPDWPRSLRDQCKKAGTSFHFKQWGQWAPLGQGYGIAKRQLEIETQLEGRVIMAKYSRKDARVLDGRTWDGAPLLSAA